jgi:hypothetical protein
VKKEKGKPTPPRRCIFCGGVPISKEHIFAEWMHPYLPPRKHIEGNEPLMHTLQLSQISFDDRKVSPGPVSRGPLDRPGEMKSKRLKVVCVPCNTGWMSRLQTAATPILLPFVNGEWNTLTPADQRILAAWITMYTIVVEKSNEPVEAFTQAQREEFLEQDEHHRQPLKNCLVWIFPHDDELIPVGFFIRTVGEGQKDPPVAGGEINVKPHYGASITVFSLNKIAGVVISITERHVFVSVRSDLKVATWQCRVVQAGANPAPVTASHGPGIEPCRYRGDAMLDA